MNIRSQADTSAKSSMFTRRIPALVMTCRKTLLLQGRRNGLTRRGEYTASMERAAS